jgi:tRNA pseudouridine38-40 synthase
VQAYRFTLEYDGTDFEGWQRQAPGHRTVQGAFEDALARVSGAFAPARGAGRTDAGVHAEGQVASAVLARPLAPAALREALNALLPPDLAVVEVELADAGFHARRDARSKLYRYAVWNGPTRSPLRERRAWWVRAPLDLDAMRAAAAELVGRHDFASFQAAGSSARTSVRTVSLLSVRGEPGGRVCLELAADGFLRHMARNLAGTLLEVGRGRRAPESVREILAARRRAAAGPTAPARGLTLVAVRYGIPRDPEGLPPALP